jgi:methyltransferase (TIGR00027 family)
MKPNKASATAHLIAASTVYLHADPHLGSLVPSDWEKFCSWFVEEYSSRGKAILNLIPKAWFRLAVKLIERLGVPGIIPHYILRKHCIQDAVVSYLDQGFNQVAVLGAGFDTLTLRLSKEHSRTTFFELDFPATQEVKVRSLSKHGFTSSNLHFINADFTQENWIDRLTSNSAFDSASDTVFIIEGVLMYLTEDEVRKTLMKIAKASLGRMAIVFTFMEVQKNGSFSFHNSSWMVDAWLKIKGEVFRWGISPQSLSAFLKPLDLRFMKHMGSEDFRKKYLQDSRLNLVLAKGESICVAEKQP